MPYRYIDNIALADVAFEAWGATESELFSSSADALLHVMVENIDAVEMSESLVIQCEAASLDMLLFHMLEELVYYKDADQLFLRLERCEFRSCDSGMILRAHAAGERIDSARHNLGVDVKAITFHRFKVEHTSDGFRATVVLDV